MIEAIGVATIPAVLALIGVILKQVMSVRADEERRHNQLDADIATIMQAGDDHSEVANKIGADLHEHIVEQRAANQANTDAHTTLFAKLGHIEGWIEGRREGRP